jgi:receptor protein-tyrosine kinase
LIAANLALAEAQLADNPTLLCDFDFRRPVLQQVFQIDREPDIKDYLHGRAQLHEAMRKIDGTDLFVCPLALPCRTNPLELMNRKETGQMLDFLPAVFRWFVLNTPPLLAASDANLICTLCQAAILVARLGSTTAGSIGRAVQSLCRNNVIGIVANGARGMRNLPPTSVPLYLRAR